MKYLRAIHPTATGLLNLGVIEKHKYVTLNQLVQETKPWQVRRLVYCYEHYGICQSEIRIVGVLGESE